MYHTILLSPRHCRCRVLHNTIQYYTVHYSTCLVLHSTLYCSGWSDISIIQYIFVVDCRVFRVVRREMDPSQIAVGAQMNTETVQYCTSLYDSVRYWTALYSTVLHSAALNSTLLDITM